jgi:hypothetical protein
VIWRYVKYWEDTGRRGEDHELQTCLFYRPASNHHFWWLLTIFLDSVFAVFS